MKIKTYLLLGLALGLMLSFNSAHAMDLSIALEEGKYQNLSKRWPVRNPEKIEVLVFFSYTCGYCYTFATMGLYDWDVPADVELYEIPLSFSSVEHLSRSFYASEILGIQKQFHPALFEAFLSQRRQFRSKQELAVFATRFGITEPQFIAAYDSFGINVAMNRSENYARNYQITSVPTIIVNGKYRTSPAQAGGYSEVLKLIEALVEKEREIKAAQAEEP
jgi:thiol:disulfide interchange protein DsbA